MKYRQPTPAESRGYKALKARYPDAKVEWHHPGCIVAYLKDGGSIAVYENAVHYTRDVWVHLRGTPEPEWPTFPSKAETLEEALDKVDEVRAVVDKELKGAGIEEVQVEPPAF